MTLRAFELKGADGKRIRGDRAEGTGRDILFITGLLSKRWGTKSNALIQWSAEKGWGFCCYDVRGFGDSEGRFTDYTFSDWLADARSVVSMLSRASQQLTIVGNSLGGWIAWLVAQENIHVERLILVAPAFNMMGVRAKSISPQRRHAWQDTGWMPWDDDPLHKDFPLSWKWVEESESYWASSFDHLRRVRTAILHGTGDAVIAPQGSREFVEVLRRHDPSFPIDLHLVPGDHRLSSPQHMESLRQLLVEQV
jgi:pimeloyl-ACP methyl ester carboxylesterase